MRKKIVVIRSRAIDSSVFKLTKALSDFGFNVNLLVWDRQNDIINKKKYGFKLDRFQFRAPYDSLISLLFQPIWFLYELIYIFKNKPDYIQVCDLDTLIPAIIAKKFLKEINIFYIIFDFYANHIKNKEKFPFNYLFKIISKLEKIGIGFTDQLFLVDKCRYKNVKGAYIRSLDYIYNSPPDLYHKFKHLKKQPKDQDEIILFYAGALSKSRGLVDVIKVVKDMKKTKLIIAGNGPLRDFVRKISFNINNIEFLGFLDYEDVIRNEIKSDILFAFYNPELPNSKLASPNKLFESMMCKKPIITNTGIAAAEIVKKENCGIIIEYANQQNLKKAINTLRDNPELRKFLGKNGREAYIRSYSWEKMKNRLYNVYVYKK
jgi:glycosyltransferase involved in cell wall biosynthesis